MKLNTHRKSVKKFTTSGQQKIYRMPQLFLCRWVFVPFRPRPFRPLTFQLSVFRFFFNNVGLPKIRFSLSPTFFRILM